MTEMLTESDLEYIKSNREEITERRQRDITIIYLEGVEDEFTGEIVGKQPMPREVKAVVTEISSATGAGADRYMENGIKYEKGDIWLSVAIELIEDIADRMERIEYDGKEYAILAEDKKGLGYRNRYEILGRLIA